MATLAMRASGAVAPRSKNLAPTIDEEWLAELRAKLEPHGARRALSRALGVEPSQISKLANGTNAPATLVIDVSRHLGMMLPSSWFDEREARALRALRRAEEVISKAEDDKQRRAAELMLDAMVDDVEQSAESLREHLGALLRKSEQRRRRDEGN